MSGQIRQSIKVKTLKECILAKGGSKHNVFARLSSDPATPSVSRSRLYALSSQEAKHIARIMVHVPPSIRLSSVRLSFVGLRLVCASNSFLSSLTDKHSLAHLSSTSQEKFERMKRHSTIQREHLIYRKEKIETTKKMYFFIQPKLENTQHPPTPEYLKQDRNTKSLFLHLRTRTEETRKKRKEQQYEKHSLTPSHQRQTTLTNSSTLAFFT